MSTSPPGADAPHPAFDLGSRLTDTPAPAAVVIFGLAAVVALLHDVLVIPQRAVFDILDKQYVFVVGGDGIVHQREIRVSNEANDVFVIGQGLTASDRIVFEGVRQVHDGEHLESPQFRTPQEALSNLRHHAE